ncbi:MAG: EAL domain-containing protein [Labilithrix sp.]
MNASATPVSRRFGAPPRRESIAFEAVVAAPRVLLVDDDDAARTEAAAALRSIGCTVFEASNGLDGLKTFETVRPHIAFLEVMTPFVDGFSTCRAMRDLQGGGDVAIVMMTDEDDVESLRFGYEAGATDFIIKPINAMVLQHRVRFMNRAIASAQQNRAHERKIAHLAYHDALTGLPNRRTLSEYMEKLVAETPRKGAVFVLDLDGFKRVNDTLGHSAGDELICEVGRRMLAAFAIEPTNWRRGSRPDRQLLVRLGGDEFVFVDPNVDSAIEASMLAERLLSAVGTVFELHGHEVLVTASIGIALVGEVEGGVDELLQSADTAMYDAKAHDRNNARFYSRKLFEQARKKVDTESALRQAIAGNQLVLYYQPKVALATDEVVGVEALLRWNHPTRGIVFPGEFIGTAEETGLIVPIGIWALGEVCRQAKRWSEREDLRGIRIAVNVSARQFRSPTFLAQVEHEIRSSGVDPRLIEMEITEGILLEDTKGVRVILDGLKALGLHIALDDFGTGYSALGYLRQFPFDCLKIDRSFITDLLVDEGCAAITSAVVALANRLRLNVVAEGVEEAGQAEQLRQLGCDEAQGYLYSPALPADQLAAWASGRVRKLDAGEGLRRVFFPRGSAVPSLRVHSLL